MAACCAAQRRLGNGRGRIPCAVCAGYGRRLAANGGCPTVGIGGSPGSLKVDGAIAPLAGITCRRAQMLALDGRPIVHIVLTTADVVPIAYCVTADAGAARSISYRQAAGMGLVTWADGAAAFLLVARLPEDQLLAMARALSA